MNVNKRLSAVAVALALAGGAAVQARYYDPATGRFLSADTIVQEPHDPQTLNRFAYVRNSPVVFTDPSGNEFWSDALEALAELVKSIFNRPHPQPNTAAERHRPGMSQGNQNVAGGSDGTKVNVGHIVAIQRTPILFSGPGTIATWAIVETASNHFLESSVYERFSSYVFGGQSTLRQRRALAAALGLGANYAYLRIAGYKANAYKGRGYAQKNIDSQDLGGLDAGIAGYNNVGVAHRGPPTSPFHEGGYISRIANNVYGVNATAGPHDRFQVVLEGIGGKGARRVWNSPGMPVAAAVSYPALTWTPFSLIDYDRRLLH